MGAKESTLRKFIASGILATMSTGLAFAVWTLASHDARLNASDKIQAKMEKQIDDIHWYFIRQNGIRLKKK